MWRKRKVSHAKAILNHLEKGHFLSICVDLCPQFGHLLSDAQLSTIDLDSLIELHQQGKIIATPYTRNGFRYLELSLTEGELRDDE